MKFPKLGPLGKPLRFIRRQLPPWNFITIHYTYFVLTSLLSALIFWGSSTPAQSVAFTDSLFMTISAMTEAGLNTINISTFNTWQQIILFLLIMLGSAIWVSGFVVHTRRIAFERRFQEVIEEQKRQREERRRTEDERRGRSRSRSRPFKLARTLTGHFTHDRRQQEDEETGIESASGVDVAHEGNASIAEASPDVRMKRSITRDSTPPARRGGPEMNGVSSLTGETMLSDDDDDTEAPGSPTLHSTAIRFDSATRFAPGSISAYNSGVSRQKRSQRRSLFTLQGVGATPLSSLYPTHTLESYPSVSRQEAEAAGAKTTGTLDAYVDTVAGWVSRNSQFHGLSEEEREKLGGCEYRAVVYLGWLVPLYFVLWQLLGCISMGAYVAYNRPTVSTSNGLNPWWTGAFMAVSAFNNSGMMTLDANMTAFQTSYFTLITMSLLILAGNTCFPIFLRLIVWSLWKVAAMIADKQPGSEWRERATTLRFLLDHPRRCYTHLFPSQHTWWLLASVLSLNGVDWAFFEILNIGNKALTLPTHIRVIDGLFQAFAVRSGGFYVVSIPSLRVGLQVLYVVMMYISVYPVVITMRNSNVYEERSLGLYAEDLPSNDAENESDGEDINKEKVDANSATGSQRAPGAILRRAKTLRDQFIAASAGQQRHEGNKHFVRAQLRAQLAHDAWWIALALFLITIVESGQFERDPTVFSIFNFLFEIVSAYGCVGISVGLPYAAYSFSGSWHVLSKLILCAVMIRGRHRGLPVAIDKAVLLPAEAVSRAEEEDGWRRLALGRTMTGMTGVSRGRAGEVDEGGGRGSDIRNDNF